MYSLESPRRGDSDDNTEHTLIQRKLRRYFYYFSWPGAMINTHQLELPLSRTYFLKAGVYSSVRPFFLFFAGVFDFPFGKKNTQN